MNLMVLRSGKAAALPALPPLDAHHQQAPTPKHADFTFMSYCAEMLSSLALRALGAGVHSLQVRSGAA